MAKEENIEIPNEEAMTQAYFNVSRDFSVLGRSTNTANMQVALERSAQQAELSEQQENDADMALDSAMDLMRETQEKALEKIRFSNGLELSLEEYQEITNELINEIENDPEAYAEEHALTIAETAMMLEMLKDSSENGWDENVMRTKYDAKLVDQHLDDVKEKFEIKSQLRADATNQYDGNSIGAKASDDLTHRALKEEQSVVKNTLDEWDSPESMSVAEQVASNSASDYQLKSEYNIASQGEGISINNVAGLDNSATHQVLDDALTDHKAIAFTVG